MKKILLSLSSPRSPRIDSTGSEEIIKSPRIDRRYSKDACPSLNQALKGEMKVGQELYIANEEELKLLRTLLFNTKGLSFNNLEISKRVPLRSKKDSSSYNLDKIKELKDRIEELEIEVDNIQQEKMDIKKALNNKENELLLKIDQSERQTIELQREILKKHNQLRDSDTELKKVKAQNFELIKEKHDLKENFEKESMDWKQNMMDKERKYEELIQRATNESNVKYNSLELKFKDQTTKIESLEKQLQEMIKKNEILNNNIQKNETDLLDKTLICQDLTKTLKEKDKTEEELKQTISELKRKLETHESNEIHNLQLKYIEQITVLEQENINLKTEKNNLEQKNKLDNENYLHHIKELESTKENLTKQIHDLENEMKKRPETIKEPEDIITLRNQIIEMTEKKDDYLDQKMNEFESNFEKSTEKLLEAMKSLNIIKESFKKEKDSYREFKEYQKTKKENEMILKLQKENLELEKKFIELSKRESRHELTKNEIFFNAVLSRIKQNDHNLSTVDFSDRKLNDEHVKLIIDAMKNNTTVKKLILQDNHDIKGKYTDGICEMILSNKQLEEYVLMKLTF